MKHLAVAAAMWCVLWAACARAGDPNQGKPAKTATTSAAAQSGPAEPNFTVHEWAVQIRSSAYLLNPLRIGMTDVSGREPNVMLKPPQELIDGLPAFVLRHAKEYTPKQEYRNWNKPVPWPWPARGAWSSSPSAASSCPWKSSSRTNRRICLFMPVLVVHLCSRYEHLVDRRNYAARWPSRWQPRKLHPAVEQSERKRLWHSITEKFLTSI